MSWGAIAVGAATVITGAYSANKSSDATKDAARGSLDAAGSAEQRLLEGYADAEQRLSPYLASSKAANRQLAIEMGLGAQYDAEMTGARNSRLNDLRSQLAELEAAQAAQDEQVQSQQRKKKKGGLKGAFKKITGTDLKDVLNPMSATKAGHNLSMYLLTGKKGLKDITPENYPSIISSLQQQIADEERAISEYQPAAGGQAGRAYMQTPAYQATIDEGVRTVNQGAANSGSLYSGARGAALKDVGQGVQQSFYNNYMNLLQNMANPSAATNLSNIGIGTAGNINTTNIGATNMANNYALAGVEAQNAGVADVMGGLTSAYGAYLGRPTKIPPSTPTGGSVNPTDYSPWV